MPLIVQSTKQKSTSFNLAIIKNHMQMATKSTTTLANTKVAIVNMYQNGTTKKLSPQAQNAAHALAQYIHKHKTRQTFAFVLGKDHQDQHLLLLTIVNRLVKPQANVFLQRTIQQAATSPQQQDDLSLVKQFQWVTNALHKAEFGILFWIYQHRLSGQEAIEGTTLVPPSIIVVNFQRVKTLHEQLQDQAWAKMMQIVRDLTSNQLKIHANDQLLPSQTKITAWTIVLALQNIISNHDAISKAIQKLIKADNIEVQLVDKTGAVMITFKNYGTTKIISVFGFKATGTLFAIAQAKIDAAQDGASLPTKLNEVSHGQTPRASDVNAPTKNGVTFKFKSATPVNNSGASTLTYEVDANPQVKDTTIKDVTFVVSGFETQVQAKERIAKLVAQVAIQQLEAADFTTGVNKTKIASIGKPLKAHVIADIKKQINNIDAQALILPGDITITSNNTARTISIVIHNHGPSKTIPMSGFISIEDYLKLGSNAIKDYLDQVLRALPSLGGALVIPEGITSIQFGAYVQAMGDDVLNAKDEFVMNKFAEQYRTRITSLTMPNSFTTIGPWFQHFNKITSLRIPNSVTTIGANAFQDAQLTLLHIPNSVIAIGTSAFHYAPLTTLSLGEALQTIGSQAFYEAQLKSLIIPDAVTTIGNFAFALSPLITLSLGAKLQTIGNSAFQKAQLTSLIIPNSVIEIAWDAFATSPLTNVDIFQDVNLHVRAFKSGVTINRPIRKA